MSFGPKKITIQEVFINSIGSLIAGLIGSIIIAGVIFFLSSIIDVLGEFSKAERTGTTTATIIPLVLSIITFVGTIVTMFLTYFLLTVTNPERYKRNLVIIGQISFFSLLLYIFITPFYIYLGLKSQEYIMYVFLFHTLILSFGTSIIIEVLNNYRYVLIGLYGSFIGFFISTISVIFIFFSFTSGYAKLISLVVLLPLINALMTFFKQLFEFTYFHYTRYTSLDQLGDIFYQIEIREKEELREEEERNTL